MNTIPVSWLSFKSLGLSTEPSYLEELNLTGLIHRVSAFANGSCCQHYDQWEFPQTALLRSPDGYRTGREIAHTDKSINRRSRLRRQETIHNSSHVSLREIVLHFFRELQLVPLFQRHWHCFQIVCINTNRSKHIPNPKQKQSTVPSLTSTMTQFTAHTTRRPNDVIIISGPA